MVNDNIVFQNGFFGATIHAALKMHQHAKPSCKSLIATNGYFKNDAGIQKLCLCKKALREINWKIILCHVSVKGPK